MRKRIYVALLSLGFFLHYAPALSNLESLEFIQMEIMIDNIQQETSIVQLSAEYDEPQIESVNENNAVRNVVRSYTAIASWYRHGTKTANGEKFNPNDLTVAHKQLPFNTLVRFTNPENGSYVIARVNDRGPYIRGREFDLSRGSAEILAMTERGVAQLLVEILN